MPECAVLFASVHSVSVALPPFCGFPWKHRYSGASNRPAFTGQFGAFDFCCQFGLVFCQSLRLLSDIFQAFLADHLQTVSMNYPGFRQMVMTALRFWLIAPTVHRLQFVGQKKAEKGAERHIEVFRHREIAAAALESLICPEESASVASRAGSIKPLNGSPAVVSNLPPSSARDPVH